MASRQQPRALPSQDESIPHPPVWRLTSAAAESGGKTQKARRSTALPTCDTHSLPSEPYQRPESFISWIWSWIHLIRRRPLFFFLLQELDLVVLVGPFWRLLGRPLFFRVLLVWTLSLFADSGLFLVGRLFAVVGPLFASGLVGNLSKPPFAALCRRARRQSRMPPFASGSPLQRAAPALVSTWLQEGHLRAHRMAPVCPMKAHEITILICETEDTDDRQRLVLASLAFAGVFLIWIGAEEPRHYHETKSSANQGTTFSPAGHQSRLASQGQEGPSKGGKTSGGKAKGAKENGQDLWASAAFQAHDLTAEQIAQRRTNATSKLTKRITGNVRAKEDLTRELSLWFARIGQHLLGLLGRIRAIGTKIDEDLIQAIQEMQSYLATQPSAATADQLATASQKLGSVWSSAQEEEIIRMAAMLRAFGATHSNMVTSSGSGLSLGGAAENPNQSVDQGSEVSFGDLQPTFLQPLPVPQQPPLETASPPAVAAGQRWKRRGTTGAARPSKSPRRDVTLPPAPWPTMSTGRTPEGQHRVPQTQIGSDQEELIPDVPTGTPTSSWFGHWLQLASFAIQNGNDVVGDLAHDVEQELALPLPAADTDPEQARLLGQQTWEALQLVVRDQAEHLMLSMCLALHRTLQAIRSAPSVLPEVRQGVLLAAHFTSGGLLDPYSFAPATPQEWLFPSALVERGGPYRGYLAASASLAPEVQGILLQPCPYVPAQVNDSPLEEAEEQQGDFAPASG
ncbi:unnamed protein product [Symbiodinium microadriaticum]|nr:unnamed protein product [Symbiodinium microadriaticum]